MIAPKILSQKRESEADLKTSKLLLFAPVVEGCDQNYNHLKLFTVKKKPFVFYFSRRKTNTTSSDRLSLAQLFTYRWLL